MNRETRLLLRFLAMHLAIGVVAGWVVLAAFLYFDIANLRTLMTGSPDGMLALILLAAFFALTFGSAGMGVAVMSPEARERHDCDRDA